MKAVLFDVDGTLVRFHGAGRRALVDAARRVTGHSESRVSEVVERVDFRGNTDALIAEQMAHGLGRAPGSFSEALLAEYVAILDEHVASSTHELLPGVFETLERLGAREETVLVGLLTGNIREGARIKLGAIGLSHLVDRTGGFGDDGRRRAEIALVAVDRLKGEGVAPSDVLVVGDTEHDVEAARAAGARAVAVATGWTSRETLRASGPDAILEDLSEPEKLLELL